MDMLNSFEIYLAGAVVIVVIAIIAMVFCLTSPFQYPYFIYYFDISGRRRPQNMDLIDEFLITTNFQKIQEHNQYILSWKEECKEKIEGSKLKNYRKNQFNACIDDDNAFKFYFTRQQTRYRQVNYVKTAYKVTQTVSYFFCNYTYLQERNKQLEEINYECTLREWHSQNQRKLMTQELRKKIMIRDNYTCRICGKYMPDQVGLHIDHIVPVSKGGKTVPSNLQVLCSKCNGTKSNTV